MKSEKRISIKWRNKALIVLGVGSIILVIMIIGLTFFLNSKKIGWKNLSLPNQHIIANNVVFDSHGTAWIGTHDGLYTYDGRELQDYGEIDPYAPEEDIIALAIDPSGRIWVGTEGGIHVFDGKVWTTYGAHNSPLRNTDVNSISFDHLGRVWVGTDMGVMIYNEDTWVHLHTENSPLVTNQVWIITFDQNGKAWIGTSTGINVVNCLDIYETTNWSTLYTSEENESGEYAGNYGEDDMEIIFDESGNAWIGYRDGIKVFDGNTLTEYSSLGSSHPNSPIQRVSSMDIDPNGHIYIRGSNRSMVILRDHEEIIYNQNNSGLSEMFSDITIDPEGNVWILGYTGIKLAQVEESGIPHRIPLDGHQIDRINKIRGLLIFCCIGFVFLWILFYLDDLIAPLITAGITGSIWVLIQATRIVDSAILIPFTGGVIGGILGRIVGGLIMKLRKRSTKIRRILTIIGSVMGFLLTIVVLFIALLALG